MSMPLERLNIPPEVPRRAESSSPTLGGTASANSGDVSISGSTNSSPGRSTGVQARSQPLPASSEPLSELPSPKPASNRSSGGSDWLDLAQQKPPRPLPPRVRSSLSKGSSTPPRSSGTGNPSSSKGGSSTPPSPPGLDGVREALQQNSHELGKSLRNEGNNSSSQSPPNSPSSKAQEVSPTNKHDGPQSSGTLKVSPLGITPPGSKLLVPQRGSRPPNLLIHPPPVKKRQDPGLHKLQQIINKATLELDQGGLEFRDVFQKTLQEATEVIKG